MIVPKLIQSEGIEKEKKQKDNDKIKLFLEKLEHKDSKSNLMAQELKSKL